MGGEAAEVIDNEDLNELSPEEQAAKARADEEAAAKAKADEDAAAAAAGKDGEGEDQGFEVVEEDGTPAGAGRVVPIGTHIKLKQKLKGKVKEARGEVEAKAQENELLRLQIQQRDEEIARLKQKPLPKVEDFGGDTAKYETAMRQFIAEQAGVAATEAVRKAAPAPQQAADDDADDEVLQAYSERAAKLKAADFEEAEDAVIAAFGQQAVRRIIGLFANSEAVIYALGKNPKKLGELAADLKRSPLHAVKNLTEYASKLQLKPRGKAPEPNSASDTRGSAARGADSQTTLDRMRDEVQAGKRSVDDVLAFKKECRAKGIKVE